MQQYWRQFPPPTLRQNVPRKMSSHSNLPQISSTTPITIRKSSTTIMKSPLTQCCRVSLTKPSRNTSPPPPPNLHPKKKNVSTLSTTTKTAISSLMNIGIRFPPRPHTHFIFSRSINTPLSTIYHTFINLVFPRRFRSYNNWSSGSLHCVSNQRKWSLLGSSEVWVTYTENKK